jgi:hypothetical protein
VLTIRVALRGVWGTGTAVLVSGACPNKWRERTLIDEDVDEVGP